MSVSNSRDVVSARGLGEPCLGCCVELVGVAAETHVPVVCSAATSFRSPMIVNPFGFFYTGEALFYAVETVVKCRCRQDMFMTIIATIGVELALMALATAEYWLIGRSIDRRDGAA